MTGAIDRARQAVKTCHDDAGGFMATLTGVIDSIDEALSEVSANGPLGDSTNPHITSATHHLLRAKEFVKDAVGQLRLSRAALNRYAQRALSE